MKVLREIRKQLVEWNLGASLEDVLKYVGYEGQKQWHQIQTPGSHPTKELAKTWAAYYEVFTGPGGRDRVYLYRTKDGKAVYWLVKRDNQRDVSGSKASELEKALVGE